MENLTHTIVGLMLARTGLEKTTPRGAGMMMLAANAPDIDGVYWLAGTMPYLEYHRTYTHSLVFLPLIALLPMLLARVKFSWRSYAASMIGVLSHLLLDWTNSYGIPLLLPLSGHRFRLDIAHLYDLWISVILIGALAATALPGAAGWTAPVSPSPRARRGFAWAALLALLAFDSGRILAHNRAVEVMSAGRYEGAAPARVTALPGPVHPFTWRGVVEGDGFTVIVPVDLTREYDPDAGRFYRPAPRSPAMEAALATRPFQVFTWFSQLPFAKVTPVPEGVRVELIDLRFGAPELPGFVAVAAVVDPSGKVLRSGFGL